MAEFKSNAEFYDALDEARSALDYHEYYSGHPEFILEFGGQEKYDAEHTRLFQRFYRLNTTKADFDNK